MEVRAARCEARSAAPPAAVHEVGDESETGLAPRADGAGVERLWHALEEVMDPEIPISLVDLGLIYDIRELGGAVEVDLTFTAMACPCMGFIKYDLEERLMREAGVREVRVQEIWNPPWTKSRITPRGRERLKEMGISM